MTFLFYVATCILPPCPEGGVTLILRGTTFVLANGPILLLSAGMDC